MEVLSAICLFLCVCLDFAKADSFVTLSSEDLTPFMKNPSNIVKNSTKNYYRYLTIDEENGLLYVGAMNLVIRLNLSDVSDTLTEHKTVINPTDFQQKLCDRTGKELYPDCQNQIRNIKPRFRGEDNNIFVAGSWAYAPKYYILNETTLGIVTGPESGIGMCPFQPFDNSTAVYVDSGNPGNVSSFYFATTFDSVTGFRIIYRPPLLNAAGAIISNYTGKVRDGWLQDPQFVAAFDIREHVYFFFREAAAEYANCGSKIYSRVARICKSDIGGPVSGLLANEWTSFLRARLNCSLPGPYPYYFDEIQDVYYLSKEQTFYALFTANLNGVGASALCAYSLSTITTSFEGDILEKADTQSTWQVVPTQDLPVPHPGTCVPNSQSLSNEYLSFMHTHDLMYNEIQSIHGQPLFHKSALLIRLVVDEAVLGPNSHDLVAFIGSSEGDIYKVFVPDKREAVSILSAKYQPLQTPEPIWNMKLNGTSVFVGSDHEILQVDARTCSAYRDIDSCIFDPYCHYNKLYRSCCDSSTNKAVNYLDYIILKNANLDQSYSGIFQMLFNGPLFEAKNRSTTVGMAVVINISYLLFINDNVQWTHNGNVIVRDSRHILLKNQELLIKDVVMEDEGTYICSLPDDTIITELDLTVAKDDQSIERLYMAQLTAWCDEFQQIEQLLKDWTEVCNSP